jgi:hypothetical protein
MAANNIVNKTESEYSGINELISKHVYDNLPNLLKGIAEPFEERERDVILLSSIVVLSNCIPNVYGIYDNKKYYPQLYLIIIAPPASGKGVMSFSKRLIEPIHEKISKESQEQRNVCVETIMKERRKNKDMTNQETDFKDCPPVLVKLMSANISSTKVYQNLNNSIDGLLMFDSEIDTINISFKQHWGDFSDVLRKAFHHEGISVERIYNDTRIEVKEPRLAICFSGTYDQLMPLIKSKNNGLFSRLMLYIFEVIPEFKNVFGTGEYDVSTIFDDAGKNVLEVYEKLALLPKEVLFKFSEEQNTKFHKEFTDMTEFQSHNSHSYLIANIHRLGLIMFRICMVLSVIRNEGIIENQEIICDDVDFEIGLSLVKTLYNHLLFDANNPFFTSKEDSALYKTMGIEFTRKEFVDYGVMIGIPERTLDYRLKTWKENGTIIQVKQGVYKKQ